MFWLNKEAARRSSKEERRQLDLELWQRWKAGGQKPDDLKPLFTQFRGTIRSQVNQWAGRVEVPPVAIQAEFNKQFVRALDTYDPTKGANLNTWVNTNLNKGGRWVKNRQNLARIVETRAGRKIGQYQATYAHLDEAYGREPTTTELAENLGWSPKEVATLQKEMRKSHVASQFEIDPVDVMPSREKEALHTVRYGNELSPEEQLVFDYTLGWNGKPELGTVAAARQLGFSPTKVSNLKKSITKKISRYL